ncbi:hypothetical protein nbrc107696_46570 [Gordonia spumicola]|uniref:Uncharacterized protein n=1 Tax=Gordonia spumicola TaxID=589161 RepID=A0A7I9VGH6_9ACTN|nr:hypothetical protein [Gordonia spumicola]GEE04211.1 hypothetical protein nbrc107696_46570 [Gordonia spumicola]
MDCTKPLLPEMAPSSAVKPSAARNLDNRAGRRLPAEDTAPISGNSGFVQSTLYGKPFSLS